MLLFIILIFLGMGVGGLLLHLRLRRELTAIQSPTKGRNYWLRFVSLLGSDAERKIFRRYWTHTLLMLLTGAMLFLLVIVVQVLLMRKDGVQ